MRVISGEARGHKLKAPKGMTTRPMADKIKESVFSMLSNILDRLDRDWGRILDLYSGSGSIGIEALSRGADWVDFVEINAGVCRVISENLEHTKLAAKARVNNRNANAFLNAPPTATAGRNPLKRAAGGLHRRKGGDQHKPLVVPIELTPEPEVEIEEVAIHNEQRYDIIFLDPPYADPKIPNTLAHIARSGLIKPNGLVIIGHSPRVELQASYGEVGQQINILRHRRHGDCAFTIFLAGDPTTLAPDDSDDKENDE